MSAFWDWALDAYGRPGAADACLALQDGCGQSVPLMLWIVWRCRNGAPPDAHALDRAVELVGAWEQAVVGPLRSVRRTLRSPLQGPSPDEQEAFRGRLQAVELEAERLVMLSLEALPGATEDAASETEVLARAAALYSAPAPPEAFADLSARL